MAIVARDASNNFSAGTITASLTGNASTVTTNANLTGDVTSVGNATAIAAGVIVDADVNASAAIVDTKLATISTAGKVSNSATTAASINTLSAIVARDPSGNFTAGTITAALTGAASSNVLKAGDTMTGALVVPAGTVTATGIQVGTGTTYKPGIYSPGTDQLAISTGGTGRLFVDASGQVGIGVAVPTVALDVAGSGNLASRIRLEKTGTGKIIQLGADRDTSAAPYIGSESNHDFSFITNNTERMRLRADGTFEIKGAGSAGVSPAVSVNPSAPANSAVMDSSGRLGLGTSGPTSALDVSYAGGTSGNDVLTLKLGADIGNLTSRTLNTRKFAVIGAANYSNASKNIGMMYLDSEASTSRLWLGGGASGIYDATEINFVTAATTTSTTGLQRMIITSGGLVGIGSPGPTSLLSLGNAVTAQKLLVYENPGVNNSKYGFGIQSGDFRFFYPSDGVATFGTMSTSDGSTFSAKATIDSSGRLLVGTSTARSNLYDGTLTAALQVEGTTYGTSSLSMIANGATSTGNPYPICYLGRSRGASVSLNTILASNDVIGEIVFAGADGTNLVTTATIKSLVDGTPAGASPGPASMPSRLVFSTTPDGTTSLTPRMTINNAGDFYFNTTVTTKTIEGFRIENNGQPNVTRGTNGTLMQFFHAGTGSQIGSISNAGGTATAYNTTSDYRLKENVVSLAGAIDRINNLQVRRFNFIADPDRTVDGFIAHEAQSVVPECVTGEKDAVDADGNPVMQGIDQSKLVPLLTAALQEAIAKIEALETRLSALEAA